MCKSDDLISRQAAIDVLKKHEIELPVYTPRETDVFWNDAIDCCVTEINELPSAQPEDWIERNKERILQAGMEGREIEFRIGGRLFAIRDKAQ